MAKAALRARGQTIAELINRYQLPAAIYFGGSQWSCRASTEWPKRSLAEATVANLFEWGLAVNLFSLVLALDPTRIPRFGSR